MQGHVHAQTDCQLDDLHKRVCTAEVVRLITISRPLILTTVAVDLLAISDPELYLII